MNTEIASGIVYFSVGNHESSYGYWPSEEEAAEWARKHKPPHKRHVYQGAAYPGDRAYQELLQWRRDTYPQYVRDAHGS